jgi:ribosome-binding protein aMBF1 (putative translation factor)
MARNALGDFDRLLEDIENEAVAEGPDAVRDLRALQLKYRLINQLIERRRSLHWSQKDLAEQSGIAQSEISKIERGRKSPTIDTYSRLATAMELDDLLEPSARRDAGVRGQIREGGSATRPSLT